jgi:short-subunit dehydrogenase
MASVPHTCDPLVGQQAAPRRDASALERFRTIVHKPVHAASRGVAPSHVVVIGATSAIAEQAARLWASRGARLFLAARNAERLASIARDLATRGAEVRTHVFDALDPASHAPLVDAAFAWLGSVDVVLIAHGSLPDQATCEVDPELTAQTMQVNGTSVVTFLNAVAARMEAQGHGTIAAITSVAGDRGRQSNYVYGAAKAMVGVVLQGLRNRLAGKGVHVVTIKPGFVDTPMTARFGRKGLLWASPQRVAAGIVRAVDRHKDVAYLPWFWAPIMFAIRGVPERVFKHLSL